MTIVTAAILAPLLSILGTFAIIRRLSWFSDSMAHTSLAGIAIALVAGVAPLPVALVWTMLAGVVIYYLEKKTRIAPDAILGIIFTASMAFGILIFERLGLEEHEILNALFGGVDAIKWTDFALIATLSAIIIFWVAVSFKQLVFLSLDPESAAVSGVPSRRQTILLYMALAAATVFGAKMLGVLLVSALLITPASVSRLFARSFTSFFWSAIIISEFIILGGLGLSQFWQAAPGPIITLFGAAIFILSLLLQALLKKTKKPPKD